MKIIKKIAFLVMALALFAAPASATVTTQTTKAVYNGAGSTGPFPMTFNVFAATDVTCTEYTAGVPTYLVLNVDYTISGLPPTGQGTGSVTLTNALASGSTLVIMRNMAYEQNQAWTSGTITSSGLNNGLDKLDMQVQQLYEMLSRSFMAPRDLSGPFTWRPAANTVLGFDANGNPIMLGYSGFISVPGPPNILGVGTVTTGAAGSSAAASITGTSPAQTLNLAIPQGIQGIQGPQGASGSSGNLGLGGLIGLAVANNASTPTTKIDFAALNLSLTDGSGDFVSLYKTGTITINCGATGVDGLDAGSLGASTWYYLYVIYNGTTTSGVASTASTWSGVTKTGISGYTYYRMIGVALTDSSSNFLTFTQQQNRFKYDSYRQVSTGTTAQTWTTQNCAGSIPPVSTRGGFQLSMQATTSTAPVGSLRKNGSTSTTGQYMGFCSGNASFAGSITVNDCIDTDASQVVQLNISAATTAWTLRVTGFELNL